MTNAVSTTRLSEMAIRVLRLLEEHRGTRRVRSREIYERFNISPGNSHDTRKRAVRHFITELRECEERYPICGESSGPEEKRGYWLAESHAEYAKHLKEGDRDGRIGFKKRNDARKASRERHTGQQDLFDATPQSVAAFQN